MSKKIVLTLLISIFVLCASFAQTITRFAVVDTPRVYTTFFQDAQNIREYDKKKADVQKTVNKLSDEIQGLMQQKAAAIASNDETKALKLDDMIAKKSSYLTEYVNIKNKELSNLKKKLSTDDKFYKMLYDEINRLAENEGYSMVLSLQNSDSILWYSQSVDITDLLIERLSKKK